VVRAAALQAYAEGFEAGRAEGARQSADQQHSHQLALQDCAALISAAVDRAGTRLTAELGDRERQHATAIVAIAVALAEAVLGHAVGASTRRACDAVERAMAAALAEPGHNPIAHLNPDDAALLAAGDLPHGVTVVSDPAIASGDCVMRVGDRSIDARLRTALERAGSALLDVHAAEDVRL
jgi:flagellar assembly protein FliH